MYVYIADVYYSNLVSPKLHHTVYNTEIIIV